MRCGVRLRGEPFARPGDFRTSLEHGILYLWPIPAPEERTSSTMAFHLSLIGSGFYACCSTCCACSVGRHTGRPFSEDLLLLSPSLVEEILAVYGVPSYCNTGGVMVLGIAFDFFVRAFLTLLSGLSHFFFCASLAQCWHVGGSAPGFVSSFGPGTVSSIAVVLAQKALFWSSPSHVF